MNAVWWVMLGGSLGSALRYLMGRLIPHTPGTGFPWHTFSVNLIGCFLIGLLAGYVDRRSGEPTLTRWLWMSGFCGGFTTFSAFSLETIHLLQHQRWLILLPYVLGSVLIGLLATWMGMQAIRHY
jgi:CrcB protein